jgi:hypothetical protein
MATTRLIAEDLNGVGQVGCTPLDEIGHPVLTTHRHRNSWEAVCAGLAPLAVLAAKDDEEEEEDDDDLEDDDDFDEDDDDDFIDDDEDEEDDDDEDDDDLDDED